MPKNSIKKVNTKKTYKKSNTTKSTNTKSNSNKSSKINDSDKTTSSTPVVTSTQPITNNGESSAMAWWKLIFDALPTIISAIGGIKSLFDSGNDESRNLAREESYNSSTATTNDTSKVNALLSELKNQLINSADDIEDKLVYECEVQSDRICDKLEEMEINTSNLRRMATKNERRIKNTLREEISKNLSLDNRECLDILYMTPGDSKEAAIIKFKNSIIEKALKKIKEDIAENFNTIIDNAEIVINNKLENESNIVNQNLKYLERLINVTDIANKEVEQTNLQHKICIFKFLVGKIKNLNNNL